MSQKIHEKIDSLKKVMIELILAKLEPHWQPGLASNNPTTHSMEPTKAVLFDRTIPIPNTFGMPMIRGFVEDGIVTNIDMNDHGCMDIRNFEGYCLEDLLTAYEVIKDIFSRPVQHTTMAEQANATERGDLQ